MDSLYLSSRVKANGLFHCKSPVNQLLQQHLRNIPYSTYIGIQTVLTVGNVLKTRSRSACAAAKPSFPSESKTFVSIHSSSSCGGASTHTSRCHGNDRVSVRRAVPTAWRHACTACAPGSDSHKVRWRVVSVGGVRRARTGTLYWGYLTWTVHSCASGASSSWTIKGPQAFRRVKRGGLVKAHRNLATTPDPGLGSLHERSS
jgi:hypothetical protein